MATWTGEDEPADDGQDLQQVQARNDGHPVAERADCQYRAGAPCRHRYASGSGVNGDMHGRAARFPVLRPPEHVLFAVRSQGAAPPDRYIQEQEDTERSVG